MSKKGIGYLKALLLFLCLSFAILFFHVMQNKGLLPALVLLINFLFLSGFISFTSFCILYNNYSNLKKAQNQGEYSGSHHQLNVTSQEKHLIDQEKYIKKASNFFLLYAFICFVLGTISLLIWLKLSDYDLSYMPFFLIPLIRYLIFEFLT